MLELDALGLQRGNEVRARDRAGAQHRLTRQREQRVQPRQRAGADGIDRGEFVDQADVERARRIHHFAGDEHALGAIGADHAPQQVLDALGRDQADLGFVQADAERSTSIFRACHHPVIAAQREHATARGRMPGDGRDHRHRAFADRAHRVEETRPGVAHRGAVVAQPEQVRHVEPGGKHLRPARQHQPGGAVGDAVADRFGELRAQRGIERIDRRARQREFDDAAGVSAAFDQAHGFIPAGQRYCTV